MANMTQEPRDHQRFRLSLDAWAVIVAFALALAIRLDLFKKIPW